MPDTWPDTLPQRLSSDDYSESVGDSLVESQPESGPPMSRPRATAVARPMSGSMRVTGAELAIFRAFYDVTIMRGALPFEFPGQSEDAVLLVKFQKSSPPAWSNMGADNWRLSLQMWILP